MEEIKEKWEEIKEGIKKEYDIGPTPKFHYDILNPF